MDRVALKPFRRIAVMLLAGAIIVTTSSCSRQERKKEEEKHLESMMSILVQVQKNLGRIRQKEAVVVRLSSDVEGRKPKSAEQIGREINTNIRYIDSTLSASKNLVTTLEKENHDSQYRITALDRMTGQLKGELDKKSLELGAMKGEIAKLNRQIARLTNTVDVMDEAISDQEDQMVKAYYIVGTVDQLVSKGILAPSGPFYRFFGTRPALANDFDLRPFSEVDITETKDIFFNKPVSRLHIITPHTRGSYELVGGKTSALLLIRNESEFWKKSRCLIVVVE
ncbi:hypothetical protein EST62_05355 [Chlorobaculum sp. 24CR]|uniref:biogenesis of lysosome-related organelles complex 1 subunit 2 n=1 Tax=Chlorobaculum sp. 24CR TaxID=2508878 RepID=UPI00100B4541|nr:biogenesis of lysosome-related organelles complex 1 subunit 2 [Chlorobaculum sp. 24CR]RXK87939.1 hypothetical protein EST62_05355 [Chlorobaculum sp. 24CR]